MSSTTWKQFLSWVSIGPYRGKCACGHKLMSCGKCPEHLEKITKEEQHEKD